MGGTSKEGKKMGIKMPELEHLYLELKKLHPIKISNHEIRTSESI